MGVGAIHAISHGSNVGSSCHHNISFMGVNIYSDGLNFRYGVFY